MTRDFRGFGPEPDVSPPDEMIECIIVENDPSVPWAIGVIQNGRGKGERTYVFPHGWTEEMENRALLEWGEEL